MMLVNTDYRFNPRRGNEIVQFLQRLVTKQSGKIQQ